MMLPAMGMMMSEILTQMAVESQAIELLESQWEAIGYQKGQLAPPPRPDLGRVDAVLDALHRLKDPGVAMSLAHAAFPGLAAAQAAAHAAGYQAPPQGARLLRRGRKQDPEQLGEGD